MTEVTIYGVAVSTYVRTARLACEEKGVSHDLMPMVPDSPEIKELHPHGKIPAFRHGEFTLYETSAICRYVDEAFDGPSLQPSERKSRSRMNQWISAINDVYDRTMIREIVYQRLVVPSRGGTADEEMIAAAVPRMENQLAVAERTLSEHAYLAGDALSLADLFLAPIIFWLRKTPEGQARMADYPNVEHWWEMMAARPSVVATEPQPPKVEAA